MNNTSRVKQNVSSLSETVIKRFIGSFDFLIISSAFLQHSSHSIQSPSRLSSLINVFPYIRNTFRGQAAQIFSASSTSICVLSSATCGTACIATVETGDHFAWIFPMPLQISPLNGGVMCKHKQKCTLRAKPLVWEEQESESTMVCCGKNYRTL